MNKQEWKFICGAVFNMKNKKVRDSYKTLNCVACGSRGCDPCHVRTYAVTREDNPDNIIPLCRVHHAMQGAKGFNYMMDRFPTMKNHLNAMGFFIEDIFGVKKLIKR